METNSPTELTQMFPILSLVDVPDEESYIERYLNK